MSEDVVLDTNLLSDLISSYYRFDIRKSGEFQSHNNINEKFCGKLNLILNNYRNNLTLEDGVIVASSFAFIEIARQFERISNGEYTAIQFKAFIDSPPEWFIIAPINNDLFIYLNELPNSVEMPGGQILTIEWADAIHIATALSRDNCNVATTDGRLVAIPIIKEKLIL